MEWGEQADVERRGASIVDIRAQEKGESWLGPSYWSSLVGCGFLQ